MTEPLKCEIVRDLLPSYVDGLTSKVSNEAIEQHLAGCANCAAVLRSMQVVEPTEPVAASEVDYLKKVRSRMRRVAAVGMVLAACLVAALFLTKLWILGDVVSANALHYQVTVSDNTVNLSGYLLNESNGYIGTDWQEVDGVLTATVRTTTDHIFHDSHFQAQYVSENPLKEVRIDNLVIWQEGTAINKTAAQLFAAKTPYVGNPVAISNVAKIVGIQEQFQYENELQTSREPYAWSFLLKESLQEADEAAVQELMQKDSCILLATIGNLGVVNWVYETEQGQQVYSVTAAEASDFTGRDIKQWAKSAAELQALQQTLQLKN